MSLLCGVDAVTSMHEKRAVAISSLLD